ALRAVYFTPDKLRNHQKENRYPVDRHRKARQKMVINLGTDQRQHKCPDTDDRLLPEIRHIVPARLQHCLIRTRTVKHHESKTRQKDYDRKKIVIKVIPFRGEDSVHIWSACPCRST